MATLDYYNMHAEAFTADTAAADMHDAQDRFLACIKPGAYLLDFGCGTGRDTAYFISKGYNAVAADGSEEMCKIARALTGQPVRQMLFTELDCTAEYDGIWACASLLHLTKQELRQVFPKIIAALKPNGVFYVSFKYGNLEGMRGERFYTDFTEETLSGFLTAFPELCAVTQWVSADVRPGRGDEKWLNTILRRTEGL